MAEKEAEKIYTNEELSKMMNNLATLLGQMRRQLESIDYIVTTMLIQDKRTADDLAGITPESMIETAKTTAIPYGIKANELVIKANRLIDDKVSEKTKENKENKAKAKKAKKAKK